MKATFLKLYQYTISLLFIFPLLKVSLMNLSLILFCLLTLLNYLFIEKKKSSYLKKEIVLLTLPFFLITITGIFYFDETGSFKPVSNAVYYLIFPVFFYIAPEKYFTSEKIKCYLNLLKISCVIITFSYVFLYLYHNSFQDFFIVKYNVSSFRDFVYHEIPVFKIHPTYFSFILLFCVVSSLENIRKERKFFEIGYIILFCGITFLLLAKLTIVLFFIIFCYYFIFKLKNYRLTKRILALFILNGIFLTFGLKTPGIKDRFYEVINSYKSEPKGLAYDSTNIRIALYNCDCNIINNSWIKGVGFHNVMQEINNCLEKNYDSSFFENHQYLSHNYYFYILICSGIVGLIVFLIYLVNILKYIIRINDFTLSIFFISIMIVNFTEDFFFRNIGLYFFSLIYLTYLKKEKYI